MTLDVVYGAAYQASNLDHFRRLEVVYRQIRSWPTIRIHDPEPIDLGSLRELHEPAYVDAVLEGRQPLAGSAHLPWSPGLVTACLAMLGGQRLAMELALSRGRAINLVCGFHHAHPERGGGFCVFNGLALTAVLARRRRIAILDCDEHGGDGTEAFCAHLSNLFAVSIFGTRFGIRGNERSLALTVPKSGSPSTDHHYLEVLDQALEHLLRIAPDLVVYQAGVDSHVDDPKSSLSLQSATLKERDRRVFRILGRAGIPVLTVLAGGYQCADRLARLNVETIIAALETT